MTVLKEVQDKLEEVLKLVESLPQGYQYKVRELCSCVETVVSIYDDVQRGIIPEIFLKKDTEVLTEEQATHVDPEPVVQKPKSTLTLGNFDL